MNNTINNLKSNITNNRSKFLKALKAAGYVESVVNKYAFNDSELLRLAVEIYEDLWESFNIKAFEEALA